jgi:hypothetical protein
MFPIILALVTLTLPVAARDSSLYCDQAQRSRIAVPVLLAWTRLRSRRESTLQRGARRAAVILPLRGRLSVRSAR